MNKPEIVEVKSVVCNPSAIGLFGLAMVTLVASSQKLGITEDTSLIIPWAFFLGACAQFYASVLDAKKNNTFGATAFGAYGFFWFSVAFTWLIQNGVFGSTMAATADPNQLGMAFLGYLIFTLIMTMGAVKTNKTLLVIFILIDLLFLGLTLTTFGIAEEATHMLAAVAELCIAAVSFFGVGKEIYLAQYRN